MKDTPTKLEPGELAIDGRVFDLYDEYCHGEIDRRTFLGRAGALTIGGAAALAMAESLLPRYARAHTISFTDRRIRARYVDYASDGGSGGAMRGYLVQPAGDGPFPSVVVIHENRGLNLYIEDVARRLSVDGFLALARQRWSQRSARRYWCITPRTTIASTACARLSKPRSKPTMPATRCTPIPAPGTGFTTTRRRATTRSPPIWPGNVQSRFSSSISPVKTADQTRRERNPDWR